MKLTSHEFRVLSYLMHHRGRVVSQGELTEHIYAQDFDRDSNTVEVFVARLRRKLGASFIETVRGLGYRIGRSAVSDSAPLLPAAARRRARSSARWDCSRSPTCVTVLFVREYRIRSSTLDSAVIVVFAVAACRDRRLCRCRGGLSPFERLRARLSAVRDGRDRRVEGNYPTEVQPLVNDLNALLEHREDVVRAGAREGRRPRARPEDSARRPRAGGRARGGRGTSGDSPDRSASRSSGCAGRSTTTSRTPAPPASGAAPGSALLRRATRRTVSRARCCGSTPAAASRSRSDVPRDHAFRGEARGPRRDARQPPRQRLQVGEVARHDRVDAEADGRVVITVDDDGPGLDPSMRERVLQRGVRADEAAPGSGLGLAIVRELAELYGGSIIPGPIPAGGLRARLELPTGKSPAG